MIDLIEKLYEETYSPKLTPQTLLNNLNLPNYTKINFEKVNGVLIAHTFCYLQDGLEAEYRYYFKDDLLYKLESIISEERKIIYNRELEKQKLLSLVNGYKNAKNA
ncbi:hypothetical protein FC678_20080 [Peribacillus simplex]|uniref:Uncharacterized protein n=1 Tax=Peribacillus simplex TaxID=1478 RepID=A0A9X9EQW3_9BACI|nr:hypothetical protein [Peribacillus simplex]TKH08500.1 hypothetical protein FC678_20080 [Peribacillus simplex]